MKLGTEPSTSPKAEAASKKAVGSWGAVGSVKKVSMPIPSNGKEVSGQKSDMTLPQHGGEGGGKEGKVKGGGDSGLLKFPKESYSGPGRSLGKA